MNRLINRLLPSVAVVALMLSAAAAHAVPAKRGLRQVEQPDGTVITLRLVGDETFRTYTTPDGFPVDQADNGEYRYLRSDGRLSNVMVVAPERPSGAELAFLKANKGLLSVERLRTLRVEEGSLRRLRSATAEDAADFAAKAPARIPSTSQSSGFNRIPVLMVAYSDVPFLHGDNTPTAFGPYFNEGKKCGRQYFEDQSNGLYKPQFDLYGPVTLPNPRTTYGANSRGDDVGVGRMVAEACQMLDAQVDFSRYDNDGDGECDVVIVLYAGIGENSGKLKDAVWPCSWDLVSSDFGKTLTLDGVTIDSFGVFNELNDTNQSQIDGIGVFCHEFSHCLGLPDFYPTNGTSYFGMDVWSLMDYGCYNDDGYTPVGYTAYEKSYFGWIDLEEAADNQHYTLPAMNAGDRSTDRAVKVTNPKNSNEYFILENRARHGWDAYIPAEGMLITHVNYSQTRWDANTVNNTRTQGMTIIPADNALTVSSLKGDLWPYGSATALTATSTPKATLADGSVMPQGVTGITRNADGTVSFTIGRAGSGIGDVLADPSASSPAEYFTLQGVRLPSRPSLPGIYLVRLGKEVKKVLIR